MKADVEAVYEVMSKEEVSCYAFVEMNIKTGIILMSLMA